MKVKLFYGTPRDVASAINTFLAETPTLEIDHTETVAFPSCGSGDPDFLAVLIWLKGS